jgi:DNA-binding transcriptional LysR family regulator
LGFAILAQRSASSVSADGREIARAAITPAPTTMAVNMIWPERAEHSRHIIALTEFATRGGWTGGSRRDADSGAGGIGS